MIAENEEEEEEEEEEDMDTSAATATATPAARHSRPTLRQSRSMEEDKSAGCKGADSSAESGDSRSSSADRSSSASSPSHGHPPPNGNRRTAPTRPLKTVRSSPNMLNEIFEEEGESEEDDDGFKARLSPPTRLMQRNTVASPEVLRRYGQRTGHRSKHRSITTGTGTRPGPSASSSDASDNEDNGITATCRQGIRGRYHRRDSSDHSSDTDAGPSTGLGGSGRVLVKTSRVAAPNSEKQDKNQENKQQQRNGKQNGVLGKRESSSDDLPLSHKISNMSLASIASLSSTSSGRKYRVSEPSPPANISTPRSARHRHLAATTLIDAINNTQNHKQVIHVRSKDFSDLMERFTPDKNKGVKFRRRPKSNGALKVDINRNGLISADDDEVGDMQHESCTVQTVNTTKCCSVI